MIKRVLAWALFVVVLVAAVKLVRTTGNPWSPSSVHPFAPSAAAVHIPGCAEKPSCRD